ncbi:hypothetical protein A5787_04140 [Mycobacterium sp. 852002-50816_SCH5313054-b]|uniref:hypothetical protein n=1 Tax=Mycobacterium sp. 852002-50816_SCH5313054-b TaxID=1834092 RepID=UPI0007FFBCB1|nr:hypothetical protein [Mycobacterium sp. 852002-50816_SCH5313054-b]OBF54768.1 hypothetical protein A5787_04140 [Mycobacterium sp. 852002-50816_SCH5313054-b]
MHCLAGRYSKPILSDPAVGSVWLDPYSAEAAEVCALTRAAASALGVTHGFGHCEVFRDRSGQWLVGEFAARPGGLMIPRMLQLRYGIDNLSLMADQLVGHQPATEPATHLAGSIAWRAIPIDPGVITAMPDEAYMLSLPGVIEVQIMLRPGDSTTGLPASMYHAAYIVCIGDTPRQAEERAQDALNACRITVDPRPDRIIRDIRANNRWLRR